MRKININGQPKQNRLQQIEQNQTIKVLRFEIRWQQQRHRDRRKPKHKQHIRHQSKESQTWHPMRRNTYRLGEEKKSEGEDRQSPKKMRKRLRFLGRLKGRVHGYYVQRDLGNLVNAVAPLGRLPRRN